MNPNTKFPELLALKLIKDIYINYCTSIKVKDNKLKTFLFYFLFSFHLFLDLGLGVSMMSYMTVTNITHLLYKT